MAEKDAKPSLAVVIAQGKKAPGGDEPSDDSGYDGPAPSKECMSCIRQMFEAGADGDYEGATKAFEAAMGHANPPAAPEVDEETA